MPEDFTQTTTNMFEQPHTADRITCLLSLQRKKPLQDVAGYLCDRLKSDIENIRSALREAPKNVGTVLRRQIENVLSPHINRPVCTFHGGQQFFRALRQLELQLALLTLARVWDEAHMRLCKNRSAARKGMPHDEDFLRDPCIDLRSLTSAIEMDPESVNGKIKLAKKAEKGTILKARWEHCPRMSFDELPRLTNLADRLPGEHSQSSNYAGIGGGGGSDIISASLLGLLLERHKKHMSLLVSTRTWATGSQGKEGDVIGVPRRVHNPAGHAHYQGGKSVPGTYRIGKDTYAEGRDLETIPLDHHPEIYMVLDQGESRKDIPEEDHVNLEDQFNAVLTESDKPSEESDLALDVLDKTVVTVNGGGNVVEKTVVIVNTGGNVLDTVLSVDTGGDVFGTDGTGGTTPDQDLRVQRALSALPPIISRTGGKQARNLVTAVVAPGVDAPNDAPEKAKQAGGMIYKPTIEERKLFLDTLQEYKMDGSNPKRFGKTTLALQECLRGKEGWTSLNLPEHVVNTWENPWSSFVFIQSCMSDIIFMPTNDLLPLIDPTQTLGKTLDFH